MQLPSARRAKVLLGIAVSVMVVLAGAVVLLAVSPPSVRASIALTIVREPVGGGFGYSPSSLQIVHASQVAFAITNWDPAHHNVPARYMNVSGTMGGMMVYLGSVNLGGGMMGHMPGQWMGSLPEVQVSHTFTLVFGGHQLNIPIPAAPSATVPSVVTFTMMMDAPGILSWSCMADGMGKPGPMAGSFTVS